MIIKISDEFTEDLLGSFIAKINEANDKGDTKIVIYLNSIGGEYHVMEAMLDIINSTPEKFELVAYGQISSCAFILFFRSMCVKYYAGGVLGMYHKVSWEIPQSDKDNLRLKKHINKYLEGYCKDVSNYLCYKLKFTAAETKDFIAGKDVYFSVERMEEFLTLINNESK